MRSHSEVSVTVVSILVLQRFDKVRVVYVDWGFRVERSFIRLPFMSTHVKA